MSDQTPEEVQGELPKTESEEPFIVDEATDAVLRLHLDTFEGPLEVLLYLIKAQEIDIFDIPIATITGQYLKFLDLMEEENLEVVGDYLVMAATLLQIKAKMIIPVEIDDEDEDIEEEDPRMELVEKLIAYRMYRDVAARLLGMENDRANWFTRNVKPEVTEVEDDEELLEVSLFDLTQAFKGVLRFIEDKPPHDINLETISVDEKIEYIQTILDMQGSVAWRDLFRSCSSTMEAVCCFLAILEVTRMGGLRIHQGGSFHDIRLTKAMEKSEAA